MGCSSSSKKKVTIKVPKGVKLNTPTLLLKNSYSLVQKNKRLLFLRSEKSSHNQAQIFLKKQNLKKRLVHNRSDNYRPIFYLRNQIIYVSGVDELKERSFEPVDRLVIKNWIFSEYENRTSSEIYSKNYKTFKQKRLTTNAGMDFHPNLNSKKSAFVYVSQMNHTFYSLRNYNFKRKSAREILSSNDLILFPSHSKSDKLAWIEYSVSKDKSFVFILNQKKQKDLLFEIKGKVHSLSWSKNEEELLFSSNKDHKDNFEIYTYTMSKACLKRQTYSTESELWAHYSNKNNFITYSSFLNKKVPKTYLLKINSSRPCQKLNSIVK